MASEFQRSAVLRDGSHYVVRHTIGYGGVNLYGHGDGGTDESCEMRDHFVCDAACITTNTCAVERRGSMESFGQLRSGLWRGSAAPAF